MGGITDKMPREEETKFEKIYDKIMPILFVITIIVTWIAYTIAAFIILTKLNNHG